MAWRLSDVIDFEHFLAEDRQADASAVSARDAAIGRALPEAACGGQTRRRVIESWLVARRAAETGILPGEIFAAGWQALCGLAALAGVVSGGAIAGGWLMAYRGAEPVNVGWFFACTVGIQWVILLAACLAALWRRVGGAGISPLRMALGALAGMLGAALQRLPGERRDSLRAGLSRIGRRREVYGSLAVWPFLIVAQVFGVFFNLGVLAALLLPVGRDVAFGWQSTLPAAPEAVLSLATTLSAPWGFVEGAHPSFAEIASSRFEYAGRWKPDQAATAAWWRFLVWSTLFYGLLFRLFLLAVSLVGLRAALGALAFEHAECNALLRRMGGALVEAQPSPPGLSFPDSEGRRPRAAAGSCFALVAADVGEEALRETLRRYGWEPMETRRLRIDDPGGNDPVLKELADSAPSLSGVAVIVDAQRPPVRAIARVFSQLGKAAGGKAELIALLCGGSNGLLPAEDLAIWRGFFAANGLDVAVEPWKS